MKKIMISILALVWFSCQPAQKKTAANIDEPALLQKGDSIAGLVQGVLVSNVMRAVQESGTAGAVDFCNEKALYLTDSAGGNYSVQRLSDKNRNPSNAVTSATDNTAWLKLTTLMRDSLVKQKHFIAHDDNGVYYYKAIIIGMPACLNCHGNKEKDIPPETLLAIHEKYPGDKATGYAMGMLRGMWKIKMSEEK